MVLLAKTKQSAATSETTGLSIIFAGIDTVNFNTARKKIYEEDEDIIIFSFIRYTGYIEWKKFFARVVTVMTPKARSLVWKHSEHRLISLYTLHRTIP